MNWSVVGGWRLVDGDARMHPHEAHFLKLDASKARACLNWQPVLPLHQALDWIIEWYRAFHLEPTLDCLPESK